MSSATRRRLHPLHGLLALAVVVAFTACSEVHRPRPRLGALPYPGMFTLYETADAQQLGTHYYGLVPPFEEKADRGIVYTEEAGFIDVAHMRLAIDWGWYYQHRIRAALESGQSDITLTTGGSCDLVFEFDYPGDWDSLADGRRQRLIEEIAFHLGLEAAWHKLLWHEVITWFGYRSVPVISEYPSAFTVDDTFAHLIGLRILERARAEGGLEDDFDAAVTRAMRAKFAEIEAVSEAETDRRIENVRGRWWDDSGTLRRYLEVGQDGPELRPWLAPAEPGKPGRWGEPRRIPQLGEVEGRDFSAFARIAIRPGIWQAEQILAIAEPEDGLIDVDRHIPRIMAHIREQNTKRYGEGADQP